MQPSLNASLLTNGHKFPADITVSKFSRDLPERILQFGDGVFLRAFVEPMIDAMNARGLFNGSVVVVQPRQGSGVRKLMAQDGLYTVIERGIERGEKVDRARLIGCVRRGIEPAVDYDALFACGRNPDLRFVVSNTTEAGIVFNADDRMTDHPPASFPAKLAAVLHERWKYFSGDAAKGVIVLPCELIERNGAALKDCVLRIAAQWNLPTQFAEWLSAHCVFANTLVDRIVAGYPTAEAEALTKRLGYADALLTACEPYGQWVIEAPAPVAAEFPLAEAGVNVVWTDDVSPYRERKVRILNGAHTMLVPVGFLAGKDTVGQCMDDSKLRAFVRDGLYEEVIPTLDMPRADLEAFATATLERFANPFVRHELLSIALNSTSKFKSRLLPTLKAHLTRQGRLPRRIVFSLAVLIAFYRPVDLRDNAPLGRRSSRGDEYPLRDDAAALAAFAKHWASQDIADLVSGVLAETVLWGEDLNTIAGLADAVTRDLKEILANGISAAIKMPM